MRQKRILVLSIVVFLLAAFILLMTTFLHRRTQQETVRAYDQELVDYMAGLLPQNEKDAFELSIEDEIEGGNEVDNDRALALFLGIIRMNEDDSICQVSASVLASDDGTYQMINEENVIETYTMDHAAAKYSRLLRAEEDGAPAAGTTVTFLQKDHVIVLLTGRTAAAYQMEKAWVAANDDKMRVLFRGNEFTLEKDVHAAYTGYEDIADITLEGGVVTQVEPYHTKKHGKLLSMKQEQDGSYRIELEGEEIVTGDAQLQVYDVCTAAGSVSTQDLTVGYDFTDFVLDSDGCCVAALIARKEQMDTIRVCIKTNGFEEPFHQEISLRCDTDCDIISKDTVTALAAGEELMFTPQSELFQSTRLRIVPKAYTGRINVTSLNRSQGTPAYRGTLEIEKTQDGLVIVNELPLEEYLYSVVPSEMPASYPLESLKAQAVSARSYAYAHMQHSTMQKYGAHVDDSAAFQVYNNINEAEAATRAVRETEGSILLYEGEIATTYFYSTSCGYGTDMTAWTCDDAVKDKDRYLTAQRIAKDEAAACLAQEAQPAENEAGLMTSEEEFEAFIKSAGKDCFESGDAYFRWKYETDFDEDLFWENLEKRYDAAKTNVLTQTQNGYESLPIKDTGRIRQIEITRRAKGGAAIELLITGEHHVYKIMTEKNIRYIMANSSVDLGLQADYQKSGSIGGMLPSAFIVLENAYDEDGFLTGYTVYGGGFGHGIGMSQNGARAMAEGGYSYQDILAFFYRNAQLHDAGE